MEISEKQIFMSTVKSMWINIGRKENTWDAVHDWEYYWIVCKNASGMDVSGFDAAVCAFNDALQCE